jgi:hypothetical protein
MTNTVAPRAISYKPLFNIEGKYLIDPETGAEAMQHDICILTQSSTAIVRTLLDDVVGRDECTQGLLFALLHQLEMVGNLADTMEFTA